MADFCGVTCTVYEQGMTQQQAAQPTLKPNYVKTKAHGTSIQAYCIKAFTHKACCENKTWNSVFFGCELV